MGRSLEARPLPPHRELASEERGAADPVELASDIRWIGLAASRWLTRFPATPIGPAGFRAPSSFLLWRRPWCAQPVVMFFSLPLLLALAGFLRGQVGRGRTSMWHGRPTAYCYLLHPTCQGALPALPTCLVPF